MALSRRFGTLAVTLTLAAMIAGSQFCWAAAGTSVKDYAAFALEKSPNIVTAKLALEKAELDLLNLSLQDSILSVKQLEVQSKKATRGFEAAKRNLVLAVETSYIGILKAQKSLEISSQTASQAKAQLQMTQSRFDQKVASKLDLISAQNAAKSAEINLRRSASSLDKAKVAFKRLIGTTEDVVFTDVPIDSSAVDLTLEQVVKMAVDTSPEIEYATYDVDLSTIQKSLTENDFSTANAKRKAEIALIEAQTALADERVAVADKAADLYLNVKNAKDQADIAASSVEYAQESLRVTNLRYSAGLETMSSLINAQINLNRANIDLLDANSSYTMAVSALKSYIGKADVIK